MSSMVVMPAAEQGSSRKCGQRRRNQSALTAWSPARSARVAECLPLTPELGSQRGHTGPPGSRLGDERLEQIEQDSPDHQRALVTSPDYTERPAAGQASTSRGVCRSHVGPLDIL
jgi:hypothetical protein